jgi:hypothetical protein
MAIRRGKMRRNRGHRRKARGHASTECREQAGKPRSAYFVFLNLYWIPTEMAKLTSNWLVLGG